MKTSNKILIAGLLVTMVLIAIGASRIKGKLEELAIKPTGNVVEKTYDLTKFSKLNLRDNIEYTLIKAEEQMVKVEMDEVWVDKLSVKISGDEHLGFDLEGYANVGQIKATIYYTDLSMLTIKNASCKGDIVSDSLTHLVVISGADLDATLDAKFCNLLMQSGARATLIGTCGNLISVSESGSDLEAEKLIADTCSSVAKSGSRSRLNVTSVMYATAESGGNISYIGSPEMKGLVTKSGGSVEKIEEGSAL